MTLSWFVALFTMSQMNSVALIVSTGLGRPLRGGILLYLYSPVGAKVELSKQ